MFFNVLHELVKLHHLFAKAVRTRHISKWTFFLMMVEGFWLVFERTAFGPMTTWKFEVGRLHHSLHQLQLRRLRLVAGGTTRVFIETEVAEDVAVGTNVVADVAAQSRALGASQELLQLLGRHGCRADGSGGVHAGIWKTDFNFQDGDSFGLVTLVKGVEHLVAECRRESHGLT